MEDVESVAKPKKIQFIIIRLRRMAVTLALLAIVWGVMQYMVLPSIITGEPANPISSPAISSGLEERISLLESQVTDLKESPTVTTTSVDFSPLEARISALETKPVPEVAPAATVITSTINNEELAALKQEVETLRKSDHAYVRSIIVFGQLQQAVRAGKPYQLELQTLENLRPELKESLSPLADTALIGIATLEQLTAQFKAAITPALNPDDMQESLTNNLRSLVKIRKIGEEQQGGDDEAILARAEARLKKGGLAEAIKETQQLSPEALAAFEAWQHNAKQHVLALDALVNLNQALSQGEKP